MPRKNRLVLASMAVLALLALCVALCIKQSFPLASSADAERAPIGDVDAGSVSAPVGNGAEEAGSKPRESADKKDESVRPSENGTEKTRRSKSDTAPSDANPVQQVLDEHTIVGDTAYDQSQDAAEAITKANQTNSPPFELPEGVDVEPQATVMELSKDADLTQLAIELEQSLGTVSIERVTDTYARVAYSGDVAVEDAVNRIAETGLAEAVQPNYVYHVLGDELGPASEADEIGPVLVESNGPDHTEPTSYAQSGAESIEREEGDADGGSAGADGIELVDEERSVVVNPGDAALPIDGESTGLGGSSDGFESSDGGGPLEIDGTADDDGSEDSLVLDQTTSEDGDSSAGTSESALQTQSSTNDPYAQKQWALDSLNAYDAWDYVRSYNKVTVATLDLGFQVSHADLRANIVDPYNAYYAVHGRSTTDVSPCNASFDHGSHVAGIIGAVANNGIGIAGITRNTANVMPIKVVDSSGIATTLSIVKAYDYLLGKRTSRNVRVVNLSMGADIRQLSYTNMSLGSDDAILKKIRQAYAAGIVTVCASGNKSSSVDATLPFSCYPSEDDNVISVINLRKSGSGVVRSSTSNYNATNAKSKDISAPGTSIYSTVAFGAYSHMSGTSMAAPYVSGVLALEFAVNPTLTPKEAIKILYATATNLGGSTWTRYYGWGEANAAAAVRAAAHGMTAAQAAKARVVEPYLPGAASSSSSTSGSTSAQTKPTVSYRAHIQSTGWQGWRKDGKMAGTTGKSLRLEAVQIKLLNRPYSGTIQYRTHVQTYGWETSWRSAANTSGTSGQSKRLEAIRIRLTGDMAKHYDVYYRVHAQSLGWMGWAKNGAEAGTAGYSYRLEAIQVRLVPKGGAAPGSTAISFCSKS